MWLHRKIATIDRKAALRSRAERRLFWKNSIVNLRPQAISLQIFGLVSWALSRVFAHPGTYFDPRLATVGVVGAVCGMTITYIARNIMVNGVGSGLCAVAIALCIHSNVTGTHQAAFCGHTGRRGHYIGHGAGLCR